MARGVHLLGRAHVDGHPLLSDKRAALLAYLAYAGEWLGRSQVAALFWPEVDESAARRNLRQLLLRAQALPYADGLEVETERLRWKTASDVQEFRKATAKGDWQVARRLYRGPLLEGLSVRDANGFESWLERERESLHSSYRNSVMREARQQSAAGRFSQAADLLGDLYRDDELAEDVLQEYLRNLNLSGRRELALEVYGRFSERLHDELGLAPLEATTALARAIGGSLRPAPAREPPVTVPVADEPRLVGRQAEMAALRAATTPFVLLRGEPGIGKTRLLRETFPGAAWRHCQDGLQGVPYHPLVAVLRGSDTAEEELNVLLPGTPSDQPAADPHITKARLLQALLRFEANAAGEGVVYDDLQWADSATLELLLLLANEGVRVLATCRRGEEGDDLLAVLAALRRNGLSTEIDLGPLAVAELTELVANSSAPASLAQAAAGNPMFALELQRAGWGSKGTNSLSMGSLPSAISEVIAARVDRLSRPARRVVQAAAVVGSGFDADLLARLCELPHWDAIEALEEAQAAGFVEEDAFRHDLLRQTVYAALSPQKRRLLHAGAASWLEERGTPEAVAEHLRLAGETGSAVRVWVAAAASMRSRGLHHSAVPMLRRAAQLVPAGPLRFRLEVELARLLVEGSLLEDAKEVNSRLLRERLPAAQRFSLLVSEALRLIYAGGQLDAAAALLHEAQGLEREVPDADERFRLWRVVTATLYFRGEYEAGLTAAQEALADWQEAEDGEERFVAHYQCALFMDALGRHREAMPHHLEALALARRLEAEHLEVESATSLLVCFRRLGETERGVVIAEAALAKAGYLASDWLRNNLADAYLALGRLDEAREHSRALIERGDPNFTAICWARLGEISCSEGGDPRADFALTLEHLHDCQVPAVQVLALIPLLANAKGEQLERTLAAAEGVNALATPVHVRERFEAGVAAARERRA